MYGYVYVDVDVHVLRFSFLAFPLSSRSSVFIDIDLSSMNDNSRIGYLVLDIHFTSLTSHVLVHHMILIYLVL